jgi:DNA-binding winged helix-turn-helix (wHTH) protein
VRVTIGSASFDTGTRDLVREGQPIALTPKAFTLLETLIQHYPAAVSKTELYEALWPGVFVEEGNLHTLIAEARSAIGDTNHSIIVTKHRFGYVIAKLEREAIAAHLVIGTLHLPLRAGETVLGRDVIGTPDVSRRHARIVVGEGEAVIENLGSKNGTWLDGERITSASIRDGAELILGRTRCFIRFTPGTQTLTVDPLV